MDTVLKELIQEMKNTINSITKVTSGCNERIANWVGSFYGSFIADGIFKASIKSSRSGKDY